MICPVDPVCARVRTESWHMACSDRWTQVLVRSAVGNV